MRERVVLVHGLGRTHRSMAPIARALERRGLDVLNWHYASRRASIAAHASALADVLAREAAAGATTLHLVTHSLGGIVVRAALSDAPGAAWSRAIGRVVMLAPPNHGSKVAARVARIPVARAIAGAPIHELGDDPTSTPNRLGAFPPHIELGIIVGTRDAKVSVESAQLEGMRDLLTVARGHTFLMNAAEVQDAVWRFIANGRFAEGAQTR